MGGGLVHRGPLAWNTQRVTGDAAGWSRLSAAERKTNGPG